jgi:glycosyltransferase involved in cell wall biosynthesis
MNVVWNEGLSVVVPCYNQGALLEKNILHIKEYLESKGALFEIIVVNDGSQDNTAQVAASLQYVGVIRLFTHEQNLGKGTAVKTGVLAALYPRVLFLDADLAIPIEETEKFLEVLETGKDIVIASRFVPGHRLTGTVLWYRKFLERVYLTLRRSIVGLSAIQDTQCGYKLFNQKVVREIFPLLTCSRFSFDTELLYIATLKKYSIAELPITLQNPTRTSVRLVQDSVQMFCDLWKMRYLGSRGAYLLRPQTFPKNISLDDFGISELTNGRIVALLKHPRLKRISIMVNGSFTQEEKGLLLESGKLLDIHLELPLAEQALQRKIHGDFKRRVGTFLRELLQGKYHSRNIATHWRGQIQKFEKEFDRLPDGLNAHEHVHFFPTFFKVTCQLAKEYQIPFVRLGKRHSSKMTLTALVLDGMRVWNCFFLRGVPTSTQVLSYDWGLTALDENEADTEILYHVERDEEYAVLQSSSL